MNILLVSTRYHNSSPSGENIVVERERELLVLQGHQVDKYEDDNSRFKRHGLVGLITAFFSGIWSFGSYKRIAILLNSKHYDVVHVHNTFPALSTSILFLLRRRGVSTFLTLHNYRFFCVNGTLFRKGKICTKCLKANCCFPGLIGRCYKSSFIAGIPAFISSILFKYLNLFKNRKIKYIALTEFQRVTLVTNKLINSNDISVKPNFVFPFCSQEELVRENTILFIGRFSEEKGIMTLLENWERIDHRGYILQLVGDGPLRKLIQQEYASCSDLQILDKVDPCVVRDYMARAKYTIFPSILFETFGLTIIESYSVGTPVLASNIGSNSELVKDGVTGFLYNPFIRDEFVSLVDKLIANEGSYYETMSMNCLQTYESKYTPEKNYRTMMQIYSL